MRASEFVPVIQDGKRYEAELYTMTPTTRNDLRDSKPSMDYIKQLVRGYNNAGIPLAQIKKSLSNDSKKD